MPTLIIGLIFQEVHLLQKPLIWILIPIILVSSILIINFSILWCQFKFKKLS
ncbi:hypothetical protein SMM_0753 [Spiroplasma mirum ATCC 29335]|nr:hypothetical protein SMM_0753 [Spiroplasma mirum ATCC 29335]